MTEDFQAQLKALWDIEKRVSPELIPQVKQIQNGLLEYQKWDEARAMVINYLQKKHGLVDPYQWAFKTIELLDHYTMKMP